MSNVSARSVAGARFPDRNAMIISDQTPCRSGSMIDGGSLRTAPDPYVDDQDGASEDRLFKRTMPRTLLVCPEVSSRNAAKRRGGNNPNSPCLNLE